MKLTHSWHNSPEDRDNGSRESSTDHTSRFHEHREGSTESRTSRLGSCDRRAESMESRASCQHQSRSTVAAVRAARPGLLSTTTPVELILWSTVATIGLSLRSTVATAVLVPGNILLAIGMGHRSTVITVARDLWNAVITAGTGRRSTVTTVARDLWNAVATGGKDLRTTAITVSRDLGNAMITVDQHLGNGAAAGITAANPETVTAPMDPQDTGTGVDPQAARAETAVDIPPALTAAVKILLGVNPAIAAPALWSAVTPPPDVIPGPDPRIGPQATGLIATVPHQYAVHHQGHTKLRAF